MATPGPGTSRPEFDTDHLTSLTASRVRFPALGSRPAPRVFQRPPLPAARVPEGTVSSGERRARGRGRIGGITATAHLRGLQVFASPDCRSLDSRVHPTPLGSTERCKGQAQSIPPLDAAVQPTPSGCFCPRPLCHSPAPPHEPAGRVWIGPILLPFKRSWPDAGNRARGPSCPPATQVLSRRS